MQCPSCQFENMPGLTACGRCGSRLDLRAATIDVTPPRASRRARRLRRLVPRRGFYRLRDRVSDLLRWAGRSLEVDSRVPLPELGVAARLVVPGWAHFHQGLTIRGGIYLGAYLVLMGLGLISWGSETGAIVIGLAFGVHVSSALDALFAQGRVRFPALAVTTALVALVLSLAVYAPAGWLLGHVASVREFDNASEPFERFDRVVVNEWAFGGRGPRPGDVVLARPPIAQRIPNGSALAAGVRFVLEENELVDRVLAGPGDRVAWDKKTDTLEVNGSPVRWRPLLPQRLPARLEITVPEGRYLVLPTTSQATIQGVSADFWKVSGCLTRGEILGGVYFRLPVWRLWFVR
jgi:hypothetical protein